MSVFNCQLVEGYFRLWCYKSKSDVFNETVLQSIVSKHMRYGYTQQRYGAVQGWSDQIKHRILRKLHTGDVDLYGFYENFLDFIREFFPSRQCASTYGNLSEAKSPCPNGLGYFGV